MGDSRIVVRFCWSPNGAQQKGCLVKEVLNVQLAADSTLREVADRIEDRLRESGGGDRRYSFFAPGEQADGVDDHLILEGLAAFDCTYYPPKEITEIVVEYDNKMGGPRCKTLHAMGWFPSGSVTVVPHNDKEARKEVLTSRLHQMEHLLDGAAGDHHQSTQVPVQWTGSLARDQAAAAPNNGTNPLPSQIMKAVEQRFDAEEGSSLSTLPAAAEAPPPTRRRRTEEERCARIDGILQRMEASSKTKASATTQQVKRMLIKSRAKGDGRLRMEDRFHLEIVQLDETVGDAASLSSSTSSFRYFSRVALVGKVVDEILQSSSSASDDKKSMAELLVKIPAPNRCELDEEQRYVYRRLPNLMPLHQAEGNKHLSEFDRVIVRTLPVSTEQDGPEPTPFVTDGDFGDSPNDTAGMETAKEAMEVDKKASEHQTPTPQQAASSKQEEHSSHCVTEDSCEASDIAKAVEQYDEMQASKKKGSTKKSTTVDKVRQMLMKGKAKGDKKLVKENDRFYLEVLLVVPSETTTAPLQVSSSSYIFLSFSAVVDRVSGQVSIPSGSREYWVKKDEDVTCTKLPNHVKLRDAEASGLLHPFDRIIVKLGS